MKIKKEIIEKVNNVDSRRRIGERLKIGDQMLYLHLRNNASNGRLTKMDALIAISEEIRVPVTEILEEVDEVKEPQSK